MQQTTSKTPWGRRHAVLGEDGEPVAVFYERATSPAPRPARPRARLLSLAILLSVVATVVVAA